jgi:Na+-transporting NADH:ubiquinone oxidoreductase subunit F
VKLSNHSQAGKGIPAITSSASFPQPRICARKRLPSSNAGPDAEGWIEACAAADLGPADVIRFDHGKKTYALYRTEDGELYATDGLCTHGNVHLSNGLVKGNIIECSKHNGRFNLIDGSPARVPVCRGLVTYPIEERNGRIFINVSRPAAPALVRKRRISYASSVTATSPPSSRSWFSNRWMQRKRFPSPRATTCNSTFPLTMRSAFASSTFPSLSPTSGSISMSSIWWRAIPRPAAATTTPSPATSRRIARCASTSALRRRLQARTVLPASVPVMSSASSRRHCIRHRPLRRFPYQAHAAGDGLHWRGRRHGSAARPPLPPARNRAECAQGQLLVWRTIKAGDLLRGLLPRSSRTYTITLLSTSRSPRPLPEDNWTGHLGFIHEVVLEKYLSRARQPRGVEYYLCGPPMMIKACIQNACRSRRAGLSQISYDEF